MTDAATDFNGRLAYWEWSAPPGSDVDDVGAIQSANPAWGTRLNEAFVFGVERPVMDDEEFARERLGMFPDADGAPEWSVISEQAWTAAGRDFDLEAPGWLTGPVTLSIEVDRAKAAWICVAGDRAGGVGGDVVTHGEGTHWVQGHLTTITADPDAVRRIAIDRGSRAASLIEPLRAAGFTITELSTADVVRATGQIIDATEAGSFTHRKRPELTTAVSVAQLRKVNDAHTIDRWADRDSSPFTGVTIARAAHLQPDEAPKGKKAGRYW